MTNAKKPEPSNGRVGTPPRVHFQLYARLSCSQNKASGGARDSANSHGTAPVHDVRCASGPSAEATTPNQMLLVASRRERVRTQLLRLLAVPVCLASIPSCPNQVLLAATRRKLILTKLPRHLDIPVYLASIPNQPNQVFLAATRRKRALTKLLISWRSLWIWPQFRTDRIRCSRQQRGAREFSRNSPRLLAIPV